MEEAEEVKDKPIARVLYQFLKNFQELSDKTAIRWLDQDCEVVESYSYGELGERTEEIALGLLDLTRGCSSKNVVLCYTPGPEFILSFLGCLRAGLIPVPVKSPNTSEVYYKKTLSWIVQDCKAPFILSNKENTDDSTSKSLATVMEYIKADWLCVTTDAEVECPTKGLSGLAEGDAGLLSSEVKKEEAGKKEEEAGKKEEVAGVPNEVRKEDIYGEFELHLDSAEPENIVFLQYTTPEKPKGAMISYQNLLHNFELMERSYSTSTSTIEICLLPHSNGFALVGSYLHNLYAGATTYFVAPETFARDPSIWIKAMSKYRMTHARVPSSAFFDSTNSQPDYKLDYPEEINLESVHCIASLRPVHVEDLHSFEEFMSRFGLKNDVISIGYALAEHTALVSSSTLNSSAAVERSRVSCGKPAPSVTVKIVNVSNHFIQVDGIIGDIWIHSDSKALGYYKNDSVVFKSKSRDEFDETHYLCTGDIGFMSDGELFVCARKADYISSHKKIFDPTDIEQAAEEAIPEIRRGTSVVFKYNPIKPQEQHEVAIMAEMNSTSYTIVDYDDFRSVITQTIQGIFKVTVYAVFFLPPHTMPCTTLGVCQHSTSLNFKTRRMGLELYKWLLHEREIKKEDETDLPFYDAQRKRMSPIPELSPEKFSPSPDGKLSPVPKGRPPVSPLKGGRSSLSPESSSPEEKLSSSPEGKLSPSPEAKLSPSPESPSLPSIGKLSPAPGGKLSPAPPGRKLSPAPGGKLSPAPGRKLSPAPGRKLSPSPGGKLSPSPGEKLSPGPASPRYKTAADFDRELPSRMRRVSLNFHPFHSTNFLQLQQPLQRSRSDHSLVEISGLNMLLNVVGKVLGRDIEPDDDIWKVESHLTSEMSVTLKEKCGFKVDSGTLLLAQSPRDLLKILKMSLLSADEIIMKKKEFKISFSDPPLPVFYSSLTKVYESDCSIYLNKVEDLNHSNHATAIVGMGGSFAGCDDLDAFWNLMLSSDTSISTQQDGVTGITYSGGFSKTLAQFDSDWYGIGDSELPSLDPHEIMLLKGTRACLESAGFDTAPQHRTPANWGVFACVPTSTAADRIAQVFNFTGPTLSLVSGSPLSALNAACVHLKMQECNVALVCGARAILDPSILDDTTTGDVFAQGEGCGVILLMSVGVAKALNRRILAVIKAATSNSAGALCSMTPSQATMTQTLQSGLLRRAFSTAGLGPGGVTYIEADASKLHNGTEMNAIKQAVQTTKCCVIGSAKTNVGDLGPVSVIAGLIKTVMVLEHSQVPGNPCLEPLEPGTHPPDQNLIVFPAKTVPIVKGKLLSAAVNSFGCAGTNGIAVVQQHSILPHMAGVNCWLVLGADPVLGEKSWLVKKAERKVSRSSYYTGAFDSLKKSFPIIANTLTHFNQQFVTTCLRYNFTPKEKAAANFNLTVLKLYYSIVTQLFSLDGRISTIASTNAMNEIAALLFAGSIELSTAIRFICCTGDQPKDRNAPITLAKLMSPPQIPVYSSVQGKILSEETFKDEEKAIEYASELSANIGSGNAASTYLQILLSRELSTIPIPILHITAEEIPSEKDIVAVSFRDLQDNVVRYLRGQYLSLRSISDKIRSERINKPADNEDNLIEGFYERFPFRSIVEGRSQAASASPPLKLGARQGTPKVQGT